MLRYYLILILIFAVLTLEGQTYSKLYDLEPAENERGGTVIEYNEDIYVSSSLVCSSNDNQCYFISRLT